MVEYKLVVVRAADGNFRVNYYHKVPDKVCTSLREVLSFMGRLEGEILEATPCYVDLQPNEVGTIETYRQILALAPDQPHKTAHPK